MKPPVFVLSACLLLLSHSPLPAGADIEANAEFVPPDEIRLSWSSSPGDYYQLLSTTALANEWVEYPTQEAVLRAVREELSVEVPAGEGARFFRVAELVGEPDPTERFWWGSLIWIPPGSFTMGSPEGEWGRNADEGPHTHVTLTRGFWLGRCEVTHYLYRSLMPSNYSAYFHINTRESYPMEMVSWEDATEYCEELTQRWKK